MRLFNGKAKCSRCHPGKAKQEQLPLFTDYSFDNLGVPRNYFNPVYDTYSFDWVDEGLGDLKLTPEQEDAIVAFLKTLSDGYVAD